MNPYRKIERLERQVERLGLKNNQLEDENKIAKKVIDEYNEKIKIVEEKEQEYYKMCNELESLKRQLKTMIGRLKYEEKKVNKTYKEAFKECVDDLRIQ